MKTEISPSFAETKSKNFENAKLNLSKITCNATLLLSNHPERKCSLRSIYMGLAGFEPAASAV